MSTNLVRSLIAGSISAVASLAMFSAPAAHAQPVGQSQHIQPELCDQLDPANLEIRAAQTSPDNWQWRFVVNGPTKYLCDGPVTTEVIDLGTGVAATQTFTLFDIIDANNLGGDYISEFAVPCDYTTTVYVGGARIQSAQYADQHKVSAECDQSSGRLPGDPQTPDTTVPGGQLPHTGSDTTTLLMGGALLVLGAGLGLTAMGMTRRRQHS